MTKEEILYKKVSYDSYSSGITTTAGNVLEAMQQYADQQTAALREDMILFAKYINENHLFEWKGKWYQSENHKWKPLSDQKLLDLYLQQKQKA